MVLCLVLNVGDQCMGSVYKDPKQSMETTTNLKLRSMVKTQRSFDKAYKHSIRLFLMSLAILYMVFAGLAIYLASNNKFFQVQMFEENVMGLKNVGYDHYFEKGAGFFSILLSSIPLSFSNIIDLLVLTHTNFAEWDVNIAPANIEFIYPHATLAFGKVAHMFFSRPAIQRDDRQYVKVFHVGGHFFLNKVKMSDFSRNNKNDDDSDNNSVNSEDDKKNSDEEEYEDDNSLEYLPNELNFTTCYLNDESEQILASDNNENKTMFVEFFRGITLCHQCNVVKDRLGERDETNIKYVGVLHDELASLNFAQQQNFKLTQRGRKMMTVHLQGNQERYDELGVVTTKAVMGHFMTVGAVRLQGSQAGVLYMKGSIASLKNYFIDKESDFQYLNLFEQKFIQSGVQAIVYAKRQLTIEETNQLIITINEGVGQTRENVKLDQMLYNLTSIQLEILGVLGIKKAVHLRNRVTVDDMMQNGVKPWIVSKEDEQSHLTALNSLRLFQNCANPLIINGQRERVVMDQIQNALKIVTDRMSQKSQQRDDFLQFYEDNQTNYSDETTKKKTFTTKAERERYKQRQKDKDKEAFDNRGKEVQENNRNVVIFTGRALVEILRDQTMQKSFMTLAYICDMMVGSEVSPIQKQRLLKIAKNYIGEAEYVAAILTTPEDQFMVNEADLCANFKTKGKSADFAAVVDVTLKDFSAISYLLFKHGNQIQMRLSKAAQAFFYRSLISFLILFSYMIKSGFSGAIPYTEIYFVAFMIFLAPCEILVYAIFYKDYGYDYLYRISGHYKYNFSFSLVEGEYVFVDSMCALFDWLVIYMPFEVFRMGPQISTRGGRNVSKEAYNVYQVILMQGTFFMYLKNTNIQVHYALWVIFMLTLLGTLMIFDDDGLIGTSQMFTCPVMMFSLIFQFMMLSLRNTIVEVLSKLVLKRYSGLLDWYADVEERLAFEEYEDPNQAFSITQYPPLYQKINSKTIQNTLKLINTNMMKVSKTEGLEAILDKINTELDLDRRGSARIAMSGAINRYTLQLNDLNKETEYQETKNSREIIYVKRQMLVFICTTLLFGAFGVILSITMDYTNIGIYYYISLSVFSLVVYQILPHMTVYLSNLLLFYTVIVIFCYTIYTAESESLQPTGLIFVLALVAGLNHSYIYITVFMILLSVIMHIFFSFLTENSKGQLSLYVQSFSTVAWVFTSLVWSSYVYVQELEKKTQFVNGHRRVRSFLKLKAILNILVPSLVRDKIRAGKKNFSEEEGEVTIIFIDIHKFDQIVQSYSGHELLTFLDQIYGTVDQMCDMYGLQKIETVGKTYMACGGLKSAEKKIDSRLLNRHHSVRVTDFAMEIAVYSKQIFLKNGKNIEMSIGVHTGPVISGVIGDTKPQFSLIGDTVDLAHRICSASGGQCVAVSKETLHFLELYTNNYQFEKKMIKIQNKEKIPVFLVSVLRGRAKADKVQNYHALKSFDGQLQNDKAPEEMKGFAEKGLGLVNDSDDLGNASISQRSNVHENSGDEWKQNYDEEQFENESNKTDAIDDGVMNVFGFNDDLNLDDRQIIQNASENQIYNLVERPKFLLSFELKDQEQEFLYTISKQEAKKTTTYLSLLIVLNKIIIFGDILQEGDFQTTPQFWVMFFIFAFELVLIYKLNNPTIEHVHFWTYLLLIYGIVVLGVLLSYQVKYLGFWTVAGFNELQIQLTLSLIFMMRNVLLRQFIITYTVYLATWLIVVSVLAEKFEYQIVQFIVGQIMYAILLAVGIHHREMIQRKQLNYERILNVEINKTNELISKLVPFHILNVIKNEKRQVDEFDDMTLLHADIVGFSSIVKATQEPKEVVTLLQKIFQRFDQLCEENKVYKVHTIGGAYVVMGYTGKIEKNKRVRGVVVDEANRTIMTGLEMIEIVKEIREALDVKSFGNLDIQVGVHTGKVVAGIIGSKVVRYDIFGQGILIAMKMQAHGKAGRLTVTEDTLNVLKRQPDVANDYLFTEHTTIHVSSINHSVKCYYVERKEQQSIQQSLLHSNENLSEDDELGSRYTEDQEDQNKSEHFNSDSARPILQREISDSSASEVSQDEMI